MPKHNFVNTVIYKLQCGNECIFGYTGNIYAFKHSLKTKCANGKEGEIYDKIRNNGGFEKWSFTVVEHFSDCNTKFEAEQRVEECEKEYYLKNNTVMIPNDPIAIKNDPFVIKNDPFMIPNDPFMIPNDPIELQNDPIELQNNNNKTDLSDIKCEYCSKKFSFQTNLIRHQKKSCKNRKEQLIALQQRLEEQQKELEERQKEIEELKQKQVSVAPIIKTTNNTRKNTHNNTHNNTQNNTQNIQNNNIIIELGKENLTEVLTKKQKHFFLNQLFCSIENLVEYVHCNPKFPQFQSITIPSLSKSYCNTYSDKHKKFIASNTKDIIERMVDYRAEDIQTFLEEAIENGEEISQKTECAIKDLLRKMGNDPQYKKEKCEKIRRVIHNRK